MKRFLKVILILAAVFGMAGLGLTAGGAAMGATMGDLGVLAEDAEKNVKLDCGMGEIQVDFEED